MAARKRYLSELPLITGSVTTSRHGKLLLIIGINGGTVYETNATEWCLTISRDSVIEVGPWLQVISHYS